MNNLTIYDLIGKLSRYSDEEINMVLQAYKYAEYLHKGQLRQSGEEYIIHPLNVAYILAEMNADYETICAGLLHDTLEDTNISKEEIAEIFGDEVAKLVDGVTKISKMNFSSKEEQNMANTRKIITGITEDVRIIIIKLADRLHNMRTLQYKSEFKQKENALETMEIFVPLAYYIGAYRNEGFGKVIYNPSFLFGEEIGMAKYKPCSPQNLSQTANRENDVAVLVGTPLLDYIAKRKTENQIILDSYKKVNDWVNGNSGLFKGERFASQWGQIRNIAMKMNPILPI